MSDEDLDAIRAKRMAQLQASAGQGGGVSQEQKEEMRKQQEDMKNSILVQVLDQQARARLNIIAMTKPEKARMVESMLIQMAQMGQLPGKLGEEQLKNLLEQVSEKTNKTTTVKFDRRRAALDSDED